jgi:hypothetical protein
LESLLEKSLLVVKFYKFVSVFFGGKNGGNKINTYFSGTKESKIEKHNQNHQKPSKWGPGKGSRMNAHQEIGTEKRKKIPRNERIGLVEFLKRSK